MAHAIKAKWTSSLDAGLPRRDRAPCAYEAYVPDRLQGRRIELDGPVAADVSDAEAAILRLDAEVTTLADMEALARLLLRAEAIASSKIEGLEVGGRRLLRAEAARRLDEPARDVTATEVLGNIDAMVWAIERATSARALKVRDITELHRRLLAPTPLAEHAGKLRTVQNWIGGSDYNPCSAQFVPPPPELVPELLEDLCAFCNDDGLPAVAQAAIAHSQFETVHPFMDGNGRTGRALIHIILRRRGLATRIVPPVSLVLATWARDYVAGLTATRYRGAATSRQAHDGLNRWLSLFAAACRRSIADARAFEERIAGIQESWRGRLSRVRRDSAADLLIRRIPAAPILTVNTASELIGRSFQATNAAVDRLAAADILRPISVGRRNRAFEAHEVLDAFTDLERQLASPSGNTLASPAVRGVPRRRSNRRH